MLLSEPTAHYTVDIMNPSLPPSDSFIVSDCKQDEQVDEKAAELLPAEVLAQLSDANWKERFAGMEKLTEVNNYLLL